MINDKYYNYRVTSRLCRGDPAGRPYSVASAITSIFILLALMFFLPTAISADEVYSKNKKGNEYYKKEKFDDALKQYDEALLVAPADTSLKMNLGSTLYRLGRFQEADSAYAGTLSMKNRKKLADAHYNLGNIQFKEGDMLMQGGGQGADEKYKSALQNYIAALDLRPDDKNAKWNIELTQRRIQQQEQQQKNQKYKDKKDNNKQDKKQDQNNQDKNDQDKNKHDKQNQENQDKKQDQNKKDENKNNEQNQNSKNDQQKEPPKPQPQDKKEDMKKKEAERIIMQFADDADTLNKPPKKKGFGLMQHKPEKDW
jgi:Ca-activated chloride channel homolog